jgi:FAD/FMN-containing dehydrogenase
VVKNVAGFDLVRLSVGAWGTLGVLVEVTVRLRARPDADETVFLPLDEGLALPDALSRLRGAAFAPAAVELLSSSLASRLRLGSHEGLLVRFVGNAESVSSQRREAARIAATREAPPDVWRTFQGSEPAVPVVVRLSRRPSSLPRLWTAARCLIDQLGGEAHASVERGVVRCWLKLASHQALVSSLRVLEPGDARIFERLPAPLWDALCTPPRNDLARSVREAFDPAGLLNRGLLGPERE